MKILKVRPEKFLDPVGLVYWARKITNEEKNELFQKPTYEEFEMVMGHWDPMTGIPRDCTYAQYVDICQEAYWQKMKSLCAFTYTIEKSAVSKRNWDADIMLIEQKPEFEGFLHID